MTTLQQTPSQTVGPYFAYGLCPEQYNFDMKSLFSPDIAEPHAAGEHVVLIGQVFDGDGKTILDAMLEFTQVDANARFPASRADATASGFTGFARVGTGTDAQHRFVVRTVKPAATEAGAPHVDVTVMMRGVLTHAFTRVYLRRRIGCQRGGPSARERAGGAPRHADRAARAGGQRCDRLSLRYPHAGRARDGVLRSVTRA